MKVQLSLTLNGEPVSHAIEPRETLADVIRERCGLTATHLGCEHGACGACTVEVDGRTTRSCLMLAVKADGRQVVTLEGLASDPTMVALKRAFHELHALQCGFCTPGMLMTARDILARHARPDAATIRKELSGQLCRCTGYANIVRAIEAAGRAVAG
jgi:carbon-monoxide dehydrogenase small subunit